MIKLAFFFSLFILLLPLAYGECTCDAEELEEGRNKSLALKYKLGAIAAILVAGAIGVCLPMLGRIIPALKPERSIFFLIKSFAAGVILSTGFIHILPEAFERLSSPCLNENPWGKFPFSGFIAMVSAIGTLMIDSHATSYFSKSHIRKGSSSVVTAGDEEMISNHTRGDDGQGMHVHTHATHGHSHGMMIDDHSNSTSTLRHRVIAQVLEMGIVVHSVIIGISVGTSETPSTIKPLVAALTFHQFFEGMGLGGCITQAHFKARAMGIMALFFSLTTPVGIAIGIGISKVYDENSPTALIIEGVFDSAAAGILIYMALVDLLAADFMNPKVQSSSKLQFGVNICLLLGAGCMSLLAKWA